MSEFSGLFATGSSVTSGVPFGGPANPHGFVVGSGSYADTDGSSGNVTGYGYVADLGSVISANGLGVSGGLGPSSPTATTNPLAEAAIVDP